MGNKLTDDGNKPIGKSKKGRGTEEEQRLIAHNEI